MISWFPAPVVPLFHLGYGTVVVWMALISTWNAPPLLRWRGAPSGHGRTLKRWVMCCSVWQWGMGTEDVCSPYLEIGGGSDICFTPTWRKNFNLTSFMRGLTKQLVDDLLKSINKTDQRNSCMMWPWMCLLFKLGWGELQKIGIRTLLFNGFTQQNSNTPFISRHAFDMRLRQSG